LEKLRNIFWQFPNHANTPLALSELRRFGWVLPQRVAAQFEPVRGMHQPVQDAISRQRLQTPKTGRRGPSASRLPAHRFDESPDDYSLAGCSPAEPASASPSDYQLAIDRPTEPLLTIKRRVCILRRVSPTGGSPHSFAREWHRPAHHSNNARPQRPQRDLGLPARVTAASPRGGQPAGCTCDVPQPHSNLQSQVDAAATRGDG